MRMDDKYLEERVYILLTAEHVGEDGGVGDFLVGHELDQEAVLGVQAGLLEFLGRELGQPVVETICSQ